MMIQDQETVYKNLLKVNQVGKKLSPDSIYILGNGLLLSYQKQEMSDVEANPVSVGFVENSILKKLLPIGENAAIEINGQLLYEYSQKLDFDSIEINDSSIDINFVYYSIDDQKFLDNFDEILKSKGFSSDDIKMARMNNYTNNIDIYDYFLSYKKTTEPCKSKFLQTVKCKFIDKNNFIYKKAEKIIKKIFDSDLIYKEDINREILDIIVSAEQPVTRNIRTENSDIKVRLMKSLFNPISVKTDAGILIFDNLDDRYFVTKILASGVTVFNIFKIVKY